MDEACIGAFPSCVASAALVLVAPMRRALILEAILSHAILWCQQ